MKTVVGRQFTAKSTITCKVLLRITAIVIAMTIGFSGAAKGLMTAPPAVSDADQDNSNAQWTMGGQNLKNWHNQPDTEIDRGNVDQLKQKWVFMTGGDVSATPAVADGVVYFPDLAGNFYAVDATTGKQLWQKKVSAWTGVNGDFARNDPLVDGNMVILGNEAGSIAKWDGKALQGAGAQIIAVDAKTGSAIWVSKVDDFPAAIVTSSPVLYGGVLYVGVASFEEIIADEPGYPCCISRGSVVALDVHTGTKLWQTYMVPDNRGAVGGYSGGGVWASTPVIDPKRNAIYVGTGNNYTVPASVAACQKANPNNKFCVESVDHFDSVVALDLRSGEIRWTTRPRDYDAWNANCTHAFPTGPVPGPNCPVPSGVDFDFGSGPNLLTVGDNNGERRDILGIGDKGGVYWALDPENGGLLWNTKVGPGVSGGLGGIQWGTATDGQYIFVPISNSTEETYKLQPSQTAVNGGSWAALNPTNGEILWQTPTPGKCTAQVSGVQQGCAGMGPASVAGGVVFVGSMDANPTNPTLFALDSRTGKTLWSFATGSSVVAAPAIVGNSLYWGAGYGHIGPKHGTPNNKLFAFSIGP
jgi:polyvinyl alcohol dehydrogenase (cytochrome)